MSGWIYIITNLAMPDLVKVELRAQGCNNSPANFSTSERATGCF